MANLWVKGTAFKVYGKCKSQEIELFLVFSSWVWETKLLIVLQIECNVRNCVGRLSEALCVRKRDASLAGFWSWQFKGEFKFKCPSTKSACAIHDLEVFVSAWSAGSYFKRNFPCNSYPELQYISSSAITSNFSRAPSFHLRTRQCGCGHVVGVCAWVCVCVDVCVCDLLITCLLNWKKEHAYCIPNITFS